MGKRLAVVLGAAALVAAIGSTAPAVAAPTGGATVTFALSAGALNITVPATADLGAGNAGVAFSGQIGPVAVTDDRGLLLSTWTVSVTSTNFVTGGGTAPETIAATDISYWSGPATATTGLGVPVPGQLTGILAAPLSTTTPVTAFAKLVGVGNNSTTWNPTLVVTPPAAAVAGTYTGTVTHSVA